MPDDRIEPYAAALRKLLKGVVYHDDTAAWQQIRDYEYPIREYLAKIGLGMHLDEIGNFAYLCDDSRDDDNQDALPALTSRRNLTFSDTLLLVLLRERLDEHEMRDLDGTALILSDEDLFDMIQVFMQDYGDARKIETNASSSVNRLVRYGFLLKRGDGRYMVRPLIRAKINADELEVIKARLLVHVQQDS
jgi:hypothetical protein